MLKALARRLARNRRVKRRLPNGVALYVSPDSQLKYLKRAFDEDLVDLARRFSVPDRGSWDIGANAGVFAFSAAHAGHVVAVEADPFLVHLLQESAALNGVPIAIVPAAAYDIRTLAEFSIAAKGRASNHLTEALGRSQTGGERARITVPTVTLDDLLDHFGAPSIVKIDVEGAEASVLRGASRVLSTARPVIYIEVGAEAAEECRAILDAAGYAVDEVSGINWLAMPPTG